MRLAISRRDWHTLAAGTILIGVILGYTRGIPAWRAWDGSVRASAVEMRAELAAAEDAAGRLAPALDSLQARRDRFVALAPALLDGDTPAEASAALSARLAAAGVRARVRMGAAQVRADTARAGTFTRIHARVDAIGDLPGLTRLLTDLEGGPELLAIREVFINQPDAGGPAERPETLRVEITVQGLALLAPPAADREAER